MPAAISPTAEPGLFYIISQPKAGCEEEYHEWYNTEHGPLRLQLGFVRNGYRYRCIDADSKAFLAIYDLARLAGLQEPADKIDWIDRRVYRDVSSRGRSDDPAPVIMTVSLLVRDDLVPEVHRWYEKEHIHDLSRIPGWRRSRRFELLEADDLRPGYTELLAVHDFDKINGLDGPEHMAGRAKPWRNQIMAQVERRVSRRFEYFHEFQASDYREP
ncbi:uncharacterized protein AB675_7780 [Cyphellophora attinorum]|uniref:EthD domain-containing protein n=1 Tax=Cyphellophora attinorum TaxID=1664694 RepID=A0A0N1H4H7_9EURO|nr:uncharacterized protein AB675_7780 [Phialophora attinorum]KPI40235.1 hypothetical protein AB675_7780 [Phialophora attinorum]